jgi:hypothetical protein
MAFTIKNDEEKFKKKFNGGFWILIFSHFSLIFLLDIQGWKKSTLKIKITKTINREIASGDELQIYLFNFLFFV